MRVYPELLPSAEDLKTLRIRLHHPILNPIVNHLDEMPSTRRSHMPPSPIRGGRQRLQCRPYPIYGTSRAPYHQTVPLLKPPDAATHSCVHKLQTLVLYLLSPAHRILVEGVSAVHQEVTRFQYSRQFSHQVLCSLTRRHHHPDRPRRPQFLGQLSV